jgi:hypothetical protein
MKHSLQKCFEPAVVCVVSYCYWHWKNSGNLTCANGLSCIPYNLSFVSGTFPTKHELCDGLCRATQVTAMMMVS